MSSEFVRTMPRKVVPLNPTFPYHVTARSVNRDCFALPIHQTWELFQNYLYLIQKMYDLEIFAFVLMPNHFHLIVRAPNLNLDKAMNYFMREASKEMNRRAGRINQTFGGRYHKSLIESHHYFRNVYKYVYRNPIRAGLSTLAQDYPYSTLHGLCGIGRLLIPMVEDTQLFNPFFDEGTLKWLNSEPNTEQESEIRIALKKPIFVIGTSRASGRASPLETHLL